MLDKLAQREFLFVHKMINPKTKREATFYSVNDSKKGYDLPQYNDLVLYSGKREPSANEGSSNDDKIPENKGSLEVPSRSTPREPPDSNNLLENNINACLEITDEVSFDINPEKMVKKEVNLNGV
jgi:hypothetical protein